VPGTALYPEFFSEGTRLRSVKSRKALYRGSAIREKHTLLLWALPKGLREKSVIGGKALYPGSVVSEFHCNERNILLVNSQAVGRNAFFKACRLLALKAKQNTV